MHLSISEALPLPAEEVFHLLRDDMPALVPYLYDIDRIDVVGRVDQGEIVHIENLWHASMTHVPSVARPFVSPELLSWRDHASWTTSTRTSTWRLESRVGSGIFSCVGITTITPEEQGSRLALEVDLDIYPERVPGLPRLLARRVRGPIEDTIAGQVRPNLENLAGSIRAYAKARG